MDYERIVLSLEQSVYNRNLINNAERGAYVEHMIVLALEGQGWDLTWPWASWGPPTSRPRPDRGQAVGSPTNVAQAAEAPVPSTVPREVRHQ